MKRILNFISRHKIAAAFLIILFALGGYYGHKSLKKDTAEIRYVLASVERGTLISSVSGTGQVAASYKADVKSKVSGEVTYVGIKVGQEIKSGALLVQIDSRDAQKTVRDAETALETAKIELDKLLEPLDELTLLQAENSLIQAKESKQKAEDNLKKAYEDGFNTVSSAFLNLPAIMAGLNDILFADSFKSGQWNIDYYVDAVITIDRRAYEEQARQYKKDAYDKYQIARQAYDKNFQNYKLTSRFSDTSVIESLIDETYETVKDIAETVKSVNNLIQFYQDKFTERNLKPSLTSNSHLSSLSSYTGTTNSNLSGLLSGRRSIKDYKESITNAERSIKEKELSLEKTKAGPDDLAVRAKKIAVQQKEDILFSARQNLADYYIRAPFGGVVVKADVKKGDSITSATALATIITEQKVAEITLNEIDAAKVKTGQKATVAFDAVEGLSVVGEVVEVDALGTVSQGVVTYGVKIAFDAGDERIKPGMSVFASVITEAKTDMLLIPNSAVKTTAGTFYVETLAPEDYSGQNPTAVTGVVSKNPPVRRQIQIGSANDSFTEVANGLEEGGLVVARTITVSSAATTQTQSQSIFQIPGTGGMRR